MRKRVNSQKNFGQRLCPALFGQARELLKQGCYVESHPVGPAVAVNTHKTKRVGGQMILAQPTRKVQSSKANQIDLN